MSQFSDFIDQIRKAPNDDARNDAIRSAVNEMDKVTGADTWEQYEREYGSWVKLIPSLIQQDKKEKAREFLKTLIHLAIRRNEASRDTEQSIILQIKRCKSIEDLAELEAGQQHLEYDEKAAVKKHVHVGLSLKSRIQHVSQNSVESVQSIQQVLAEKKKYLKAKHMADKIAWPLTIVLCMLGVGIVCGIALFTAFPVIGVVGFLALSAIIGYVEVPVFYSFVKRSLRNIFARGLFDAIDNHLLKQEAKKATLNDRHEMDASKKQSILDKYAALRYFKYALTSVGGLISLIAAVGFSALAYMQVVETLALIGIVGTAAAVLPWVIVPFAFLYIFVISDNIYRAIKNNIFTKWGAQISKLYESFKMENWDTASHGERFVHVIAQFAKALGIVVVLSVAVLANVFSAGAWLQGSVEFFAKAFNAVETVANAIGWVVGGIQLVTTFSFSLENVLTTVGKLGKVAQGIKKGVVDYVNESIDLVNAEPYIAFKAFIAIWRVIRPLFKFFPLIIHIGGVGALSAQGTDAAILHPTPETEGLVKGFVAGAQMTCEGLEDAHTLMHDHSHHKEGDNEIKEFIKKKPKKKHDDHEHADPAADVEWAAGKVKAGIVSAISFFKRCGEPATVPQVVKEKTISIQP